MNEIQQSHESGFLLRCKVYDKFSEWGIQFTFTHARYKHLCWLFGCQDLEYRMDDKQSSMCHKLAGPYGYAIYKALLARKRDSLMIARRDNGGKSKTQAVEE